MTTNTIEQDVVDKNGSPMEQSPTSPLAFFCSDDDNLGNESQHGHYELLLQYLPSSTVNVYCVPMDS